MTINATGAPEPSARWRFYTGIALVALTALAWLLIPTEAALGLPASTIATTAAAIAVGNKVVLVIAIAVMGKPGFAILRAKILRQFTPPPEVSLMRHRIGLVMFFIPLLQGLLETWASQLGLSIVQNRLSIDVLTDIMLIASVFVLGGNFWDKLRALFSFKARAVFPE